MKPTDKAIFKDGERVTGPQRKGNWRSPPRPVTKMAEARKPYNWRTQENGGRREGGGGARSSCEAA